MTLNLLISPSASTSNPIQMNGIVPLEGLSPQVERTLEFTKPGPPNMKQDSLREKRADAENPFPVDRRVLREVVTKKMKVGVVWIKFLNSGTFHKAFLVLLEDGREIVARIARRFMPRLKTESEVATINYLRKHTCIPVPTIYYYNSNPYNGLGGEYIIMAKATGVPLSELYHDLSDKVRRQLLKNLVAMIIPLFAHRFDSIGSLYQRKDSSFYVGPIVSWPFFGEGRGFVDLDRGPWKTETAYIEACAKREIDGVKRESTGSVNSHKPHLPPVSEESPDNSDEDSSEGELFYRDYRSSQRSSLLVAQQAARMDSVQADMKLFVHHMTATLGVDDNDPDFAAFSLHLHDLSLANIFVDREDNSKITCIIDWESTTVRPLWHCAHLPSFLSSSPTSEEADYFREEAGKLGDEGKLWVRGEREREAWRAAHKAIEWDGWEEGLVGGILGGEGEEVISI